MKRSCRFGLRLGVNLVIAVVAFGLLFMALEPGAEAYEYHRNWRRSATPSPDPTATPAPSPAPTPSPDPTAKPTPTSAPSSTPTPTPSPSPTPQPSATPTSTVLTSTLTLTSDNNGQTFNNYRISTTSGDCVDLNGVSNVTLQNFQIGPCGTNNTISPSNGVNISDGSSGINIYDSYIHVQNLASGCCDTHDGIVVNSGTNVTIQGNMLAFNETNIETFSTGTVANGNFLLNPQGPFPRGQQWQSSAGASDVTVENNRTLSCQQASNVCAHSGDVFCLACNASTLAADSFPYFANQEDAINIFETTTYAVSGNWIEGGDSPSGQGILIDSGSSGGTIINNVEKDTGQGCIGPTQGSGTISGNKCLSLTDIDVNENGLYMSNDGNSGSCGPWTITNNTISNLYGAATLCNPATSSCQFNSFGEDGSCSYTLGSGNTFDAGTFSAHTAAGYEALNPIVTTNPPPLIPPIPKNCVATSPYSTQTSLPPCS